MTKTRPFLSMCYGDPSATEVPPCCETATKKLTFSTTSVLLLLNMPLSLSRATIFRRQKNPRRVYRPKIAGILFVCNEPDGKYYTVPDPTDDRPARVRAPPVCVCENWTAAPPACAQSIDFGFDGYFTFRPGSVSARKYSPVLRTLAYAVLFLTKRYA